MDAYNKYKMSARLMMLGMLAIAEGMQVDPNKQLSEDWDKQNRGIPKGYGVHLSKSERKGKTLQELQAMREAKLNGV